MYVEVVIWLNIYLRVSRLSQWCTCSLRYSAFTVLRHWVICHRTFDHWRREHYAVPKRWAPITQWCGTISKKNVSNVVDCCPGLYWSSEKWNGRSMWQNTRGGKMVILNGGGGGGDALLRSENYWDEMKGNLLNVIFFKFIVSVRDGDCDSSPWATRTPATPLLPAS